MAKNWLQLRRWLNIPREKGWRMGRIRILRLKRLEEDLSTIVTILLRIGALFLIGILIVFIIRVFRDQGFVIESFSVPASLTAAGYDGAVVARRLHDEVLALKDLARSVKEDSVLLTGDQEPELDVAVLGIGFSLRSLTYHLRDLLGRRNKLIRGEIVRLDSCYIYLERAFQLGMDPAQIPLTMPPYPTLAKQRRFQELVKKYQREEGDR